MQTERNGFEVKFLLLLLFSALFFYYHNCIFLASEGNIYVSSFSKQLSCVAQSCTLVETFPLHLVFQICFYEYKEYNKGLSKLSPNRMNNLKVQILRQFPWKLAEGVLLYGKYFSRFTRVENQMSVCLKFTLASLCDHQGALMSKCLFSRQSFVSRGVPSVSSAHVVCSVCSRLNFIFTLFKLLKRPKDRDVCSTIEPQQPNRLL